MSIETESGTIASGDIKESNAGDGNDEECVQFVCNYVLKTMRMKYDKWIKLMTTDEYRQIMNEWQQNTQQKVLVISLTPIGSLWPMLQFPLCGRGKHCYFIKKYDEPINLKDIKSSLIYGDISSYTLDCLAVVLETVYYPLIANPLNQIEWPEPVKDDIMIRFHELRECVSVVKGKAHNQTILPMPFNINEITTIGKEIIEGKSMCDLKTQNILEGIVIKWSYLVNDIIIDTSAKLFTNDVHPTPLVEINFWNNRHLNLQNVYVQLIEDNRKMVGTILEKLDSVYYGAFRQTFQQTVTALIQARDNSLHLNALAEHFLTFEKTYFHECGLLIEPMLHCFALMWANSKYYSNHWVNFFRMVGNLLVQESSRNLDPETMFQADVEDVLQKITDTILVFDYIREQVIEYKSNLLNYKKPTTYAKLWNFRFKDVFHRIEEYENRLRDIKSIFQAANDFFKLEKVEFGGVKGRQLNRRKLTILNEYQMLFNAWSSIEFDPLLGSSKEFQKAKFNYQVKAESLERKLAQIIDEAFDGCCTTEHCLKLLEIISTLAYRPIIYKQVEYRFKLVFDYYNENFENVLDYFEESVHTWKNSGLTALQINHGLPPVAGALQWFWALRMRLEQITQDMEYLDFTIFRTEDGEKLISRKDDFVKQSIQIESEIFNEWCDNVPNDIHLNMVNHLLIRLETNELSMNFDNKLILAFKECQMLTRMNYGNLPQCAVTLFEKSDSLWNIRVSLTRIVERYNFIQNKTEKCEYEIVVQQIADIDIDLKLLTNEFTWIDYDQEHINQMYTKISHLYNRINKTQENIRNIINSINIWGNIPLYQRNVTHSKHLLDIDNRTDKCKLRSTEAINSKSLIQYTMEENYRLFFDFPIMQPPLQLPCKNRLKKTILRQLDRHGKEKSFTPIVTLKTICDMQKENGMKLILAEKIVKTADSLKLFRPYEEYVDGLIAEALMNAIKKRCD